MMREPSVESGFSCAAITFKGKFAGDSAMRNVKVATKEAAMRERDDDKRPSLIPSF